MFLQLGWNLPYGGKNTLKYIYAHSKPVQYSMINVTQESASLHIASFNFFLCKITFNDILNADILQYFALASLTQVLLTHV